MFKVKGLMFKVAAAGAGNRPIVTGRLGGIGSDSVLDDSTVAGDWSFTLLLSAIGEGIDLVYRRRQFGRS